MQYTRTIIANNVTLTGSPVASSGVNCGVGDQHALYPKWTPAASGRTLTITIELSPSEAVNTADSAMDWHQYGEYDNTDADTKGQTQMDYQYTSTGTTPVYLAPIILAFPATRFRVKYSESGGGGGSLTITDLSRPSC